MADYITLQSKDGDLALNENGDGLVLLTNAVGYREKIQQALKLRKGSCVYDLTAGFEWDLILGSSNSITYNTRLRNFFDKFVFVTKTVRVNTGFDSGNRIVNVNFVLETDLGEQVDIEFNTTEIQ